MPNITINGLSVAAKEGTSVLQAAAEAGVEIPHYCYHPGLQVAGSCRMCQVEVTGMSKLAVACNTPVKEGMVVTTNNEKVHEAQHSVLEFLLVNHPLDCPVCDQAGECGLQDYYMRFGRNGSRLADNKLKRQKAKPLGPYVILDQDRCILCSRCVRFCQEVPKTSELGVFNRGDHSVVDIYPGHELINKYSGNVVDICPVGALTDRDFRFQVRVWYLREGDSICTGCSRGCNTRTYYNPRRHHHAGGRRVVRLKPRFNAQVNKWWMCDEGRYDYRFMDDGRLLQPRRQSGGTGQDLTWQEASNEVAAKLKAVLESYGPNAIAVAGSAQLPNEDLYLVRKVFGEGLGIEQLAFGNPADKPGSSDNLLINADKNPNRRGAQALGWSEGTPGGQGPVALAVSGKLKALIVFRQDLGSVLSAEALAALAKSLDLFVFVGTNECVTSRAAHFSLPAAVSVERDGTFTNCDGLVQRFFRVVNPVADALPDWRIVQEWAKAAGLDYSYRRCEDIFKEMAAAVPAFSGVTYSGMAKRGQRLADSQSQSLN